MDSKRDKEINYVEQITPSTIENLLFEETCLSVSYRWELPDGRQIFVHLTLTQKTYEGKTAVIARTNFDSEDVRGQGKHLWKFMKRTLTFYAQRGFGKVQPSPILHEVLPNEFSTSLPANDEEYQERDSKYYAVYK